MKQMSTGDKSGNESHSESESGRMKFYNRKDELSWLEDSSLSAGIHIHEEQIVDSMGCVDRGSASSTGRIRLHHL